MNYLQIRKTACAPIYMNMIEVAVFKQRQQQQIYVL